MTDLKSCLVRGLINLNRRKLLHGQVRIYEASAGEIAGLELLERLLVELRLELLKNIRELCGWAHARGWLD